MYVRPLHPQDPLPRNLLRRLDARPVPHRRVRCVWLPGSLQPFRRHPAPWRVPLARANPMPCHLQPVLRIVGRQQFDILAPMPQQPRKVLAFLHLVGSHELTVSVMEGGSCGCCSGSHSRN